MRDLHPPISRTDPFHLVESVSRRAEVAGSRARSGGARLGGAERADHDPRQRRTVAHELHADLPGHRHAIFYVRYPEGWSTRRLREQIRNAIVEATKKSYLRPNAVDSLTDKNSGNNLGDDAFPTIHFEEVEGDGLAVAVLLKGGGGENVVANYSLTNSQLAAGRVISFCNATADWAVAGAGTCDENTGVAGLQINLTPDAATDDFPLTLGNYIVYAKIVDMVVGNSDVGGIVASGTLGGSGVVSASTGFVNPPSRPYLYRMEIDARSTANPREHSRISMLYAYVG